MNHIFVNNYGTLAEMENEDPVAEANTSQVNIGEVPQGQDTQPQGVLHYHA